MIWQYGNYKFNCNLQPPTVDKFKKWKDKFFKLENVDKYNVWLCGGFIEDWNTKDIDIVLNKSKKYLSRTMIPLSSLKNQIVFDDMGEDYSCESGYCFT